MEFKRLDKDNIDEIVNLRIAQLKDEGAIESFDLRPNLYAFYNEQLSSNNFIIFGCFDNDKISLQAPFLLFLNHHIITVLMERLDFFLVCM